MKISSAFPSNYLKATDLQDKPVKVTMDHVSMETIGEDQKPVLYFKGKEKGFVINKTNANNIAAVYGDDTEDWSGKEVVLFPTLVDFQGKSVEAIRVRGPKTSGKVDPISTAPQHGNFNVGGSTLNDDIPFAPEFR